MDATTEIVKGAKGLAMIIGCSERQARRLRHFYKDAIIYKSPRNYDVNVQKVREIDYMKMSRSRR